MDNARFFKFLLALNLSWGILPLTHLNKIMQRSLLKGSEIILGLILAISLINHAYALADISTKTNFSGWHLPLPSGEWAISVGPCTSTAKNKHSCKDFEQKCAIEIAPVSDTNTTIPVLAPQSGQVFFVGSRNNKGIDVILQHSNGYVSVFTELTYAVVKWDQEITQGDVIGYVVQSNSNLARFRFHIQPDLVQRACITPDGLDQIDYEAMRVISHNLAWDQVAWVTPPNTLLENLPPVIVSKLQQIIPLRISITPNTHFRIPVLLTGVISNTTQLGVVLGGVEGILWSSPFTRTAEGALFRLPIKSLSAPGIDTWSPATGHALADKVFTLVFTVTQTTASFPAVHNLPAYSELISPSSYSYFRHSPPVCWQMPLSNHHPLEARVVIAGPTRVDSGWSYSEQAFNCWHPPDLPAGVYLWKVFVRDSTGGMTGIRQYPWAFVIR